MQPLNIIETLDAISPARLSSYRNIFNPADEYELYGVYCWNESVSQCFQILLATIEVTLRNSMHRNFAAAQLSLNNHQQKNWYEHLDLQFKSEEKVKKITHKRKGQNQLPLIPAPSPNDVVAGLTFGFWKHLLDVVKYKDGTPVGLAQVLTSSFPNHPNSSVSYWSKLKWQDKLFSRLDLVADIRNRIAHLEPIWKFGELREETRPRPTSPQIIVQPAPITPADCVARLILVLNRSIELLHWISKHRARDFRDSSNNKKLRYLLTTDAIDSFKAGKGNRTLNKFGLYKIIRAKRPVDGILHFDQPGFQPVIIMPWST
ncbi:Abi family protein [Brucella sp. HL-2]|nr:Abi family protein [Brucella sp. HL-2]MCV9907048.1 Abi family protein [Brucella sp. HL-2]